MFLPLFSQIDRMLQMGRVNLAIEGGSASGKTTLSQLLHEIYDCTVFHMDDFFLRPYQRTAERLAQPGGNVDRERFLQEVLLPLHQKQEVTYHPYDCHTRSLLSPITVMPTELTVIEGAYSMHPDLANYYNLSVFLDISPQLQEQRIQKRNSPEMAKRFLEEWIPLEQQYFRAMQIKNCCDLIF
ncbi:MAG: phosphoribulokinase [Lachnospiraceae bacterium]|nr:phosphoribulokinase [Lachnospiraceae bacterium]